MATLVIACAIGCKSEPVVLHYGLAFDDGITYSDRAIVELDSVKSYGQLKKMIDSLACDAPMPIFKFDTGDTIKFVLFYNICWDTYAHIRPRNLLTFVDNKVKRDREYDLSEIDLIMHNHYFNPEGSEYWSQHPHKAIVNIKFEEITIDGLPYLLNTLTNAHDKLKLDIPIVVMFDFNWNRRG